ncbi:hypothetical protein cypCar_00037643 [Cyprinus carpio]|nr:hypothetical protein cypCar_00037643 [Cyprinus carpio]
MEGTHTVLRLYKPIQELCFISLYFPTRKSRCFPRADQTPREVRPRDEDAKQRGQYYCEGTQGAVTQLHWLAAEHHQLLTELLSLCSACTDRIKMGNQDGKLLDGYREHLGGDVSSTFSLSPEHKRAASRVCKLKKLGSQKMDSAEEFLQSRIKNKVQRGASEFSPKAPGTPISFRGRDTPGSDSYVSVSSEPFLSMEEHFQIGQDGWEFMEEPHSLESEMDLSEFDNRLTLEYDKALENGNIVGNQRGPSTFGSLETNQRDVRSDDVATTQNPTASKERLVSGSSLDVDHRSQRAAQEEIKLFTPVNAGSNFSPSNSRSCKLRSWSRSPTSISLSGVFNVSYPPANSLQSMSPVLSPLSSLLPSPQMNHRIVLLPEDDDGNKRSSRDEPKVTNEVTDKNGNHRTVTRLDLNLSDQKSLLRPEDIWMLDADEFITQEALRRPSRPDHLDFLRITPPEDDIIGDTPCNPKLGLTTTAVLTSFQTLPEEHANGHIGVADPLRTKSGDGLEENVEPDHHYSSSQTSSDPYLVQVTRVQTEHKGSVEKLEPFVVKAESLVERSLKDASILSRTGSYGKINRSLDFSSRILEDSKKEVPSWSVRRVDTASEILSRSFTGDSDVSSWRRVLPLHKPEADKAGEDVSSLSEEGNSEADPASLDSPKGDIEIPASVLPTSDLQPETKGLSETLSGSERMPDALSPPPKDSKLDGSLAKSSGDRHQLPALFSGLRVLKKGAVGDERETLSEIKQRDTDRALLSLKQNVNKAKLQQNTSTGVTKKKNEPRSLSEITGLLQKASKAEVKQNEDKSDAADPSAAKADGGSKPGTDASFDALKSKLFGSKPAKKDPVDAALDLDAVRRKKKNDKELLRSIFERQSKAPVADIKSPTEEKSEVTSPSDGEDRTPGRLQAVWPPPKEDGEEKVGLRYTEAEAQMMLCMFLFVMRDHTALLCVM